MTRIFDNTGTVLIILGSLFLGSLTLFIIFECMKLLLLKRRLNQLDHKLAVGEIDILMYKDAKSQAREQAMDVSMILRTMG